MQTQTIENINVGVLPTIKTNEDFKVEFERAMGERLNKFIEFLVANYEFHQPERVVGFLAENFPVLIDLLEEAPAQIRKRFGEDVKLRLQMALEPESPESRELFIGILTTLSAEEAIALLDKVDEEWWLDASVIADCKLNLILEFI